MNMEMLADRLPPYSTPVRVYRNQLAVLSERGHKQLEKA